MKLSNLSCMFPTSLLTWSMSFLIFSKVENTYLSERSPGFSFFHFNRNRWNKFLFAFNSFVKQPTLENKKTFTHLLFGSISISIIIFFFLGGGGGSFATFLFTIKMITVHAAICTLLRYDCWRVRKFWNISHTALNFKRLLVIEKWPTKWHLELTLILCFMLPYH